MAGPGVGVVTGPNARLTIGDNTYITASSVVYCAKEIEIGSNCAIAWNTTIMDTDFHSYIYYPDGTQNELTAPVGIGDKVWIGCNTTILIRVTIGDNAVIGANTLVNKDVPPNSWQWATPCASSGKELIGNISLPCRFTEELDDEGGFVSLWEALEGKFVKRENRQNKEAHYLSGLVCRQARAPVMPGLCFILQ